MSTALKICGSVFRSRSMWSSSTRLMGDKTPSTGIPCLENAECSKPCQEENSTYPKPCPEKASCPESCPEEKDSLPKDVCMQNDKCPKDESVKEKEWMQETCQEEACEEDECLEDQMDVPGLSTAVLCVPEGDVGPGVSKCSEYKNPEYFSFHRMSFHEAEVEMACYRNKQPSAKAKKADEPEQ